MTVSGLRMSSADRQSSHKREPHPQDSVRTAETKLVAAAQTLQDQKLMAESKDLSLQNEARSETISETEK